MNFWKLVGKSHLIVMLLAFFTFAAGGGHAQLAVTTATLTGTVTDSTGATIPQASVTLVSTAAGISRTTTTTPGGYYLFSQLPPAAYNLTIQAKGFRQYKQVGITLDAGQSASQNVTLSLGSETQQVVVSAQASMLDTDNANISADVDSKQIVELPLNWRNIYGLTILNSSVNNQSEAQVVSSGTGTDDADQDISFFNFGGGLMGDSAFLLDGAWDTDSTGWGAVVYIPSVDAVQEFKIQNNSFTSQYGWSTGNVVDVVTKSGTDTFHGDAYEFYRNSALDANLWFYNYNDEPKLAFSRNQMGVSGGGPLYIPKLYEQRHKTFIFGLYERLSLSSPELGTYSVPDTAFRSGDFSALLGSKVGTDALGRPIYSGQIYNPFSTRAITAGVVDPVTGLTATQTGDIRDPVPNNNIAPLGPLNAIAETLVGYYPNPTNSGLVNNFTPTGTVPAQSNEYLMRVDHNVSDNSRWWLRYSDKQEYKWNTANLWGSNDPAGPGNFRPNNRWDVGAGYIQIFNPTFTMNITAGVNLWNEAGITPSNGFKGSSLGLPSYLDTNTPEFPVVSVGSQSSMGPGTIYNDHHGPQATVSTDFIKTVDRHTVSFGFMGIEIQTTSSSPAKTSLGFSGTFTKGPNPLSPTANTGNGLAQMLLGVLDGGSTGTASNPAVAKHYFGWYLQDDWRLASKLTLNLGLRYEIQTSPTYRHNNAAIFNPSYPNPIGSALRLSSLPGALVFLSSSNRGIYHTNYDNFAPRIAFAWEAQKKLVVRGGYGFFYPTSIEIEGNMASTSGFSSSTPITTTLNTISPNPAVTLSNPWPYGYIADTGNSLGVLQNVGLSVTSNIAERPSSYVQQYMFGLQYALAANDEISVDYVGNRGVHLMRPAMTEDQLNPSYLSLGTSVLSGLVANPFYGSITANSCSLNQPTVPYYELLRPYPQYCGVTENDIPAGFSGYNALEVEYKHRVTKGLDGRISYTFSKMMDDVGAPDPGYNVGYSTPANTYDLAAEKSVDGSDTPHTVVTNLSYLLPFGRNMAFGKNMNRAVDAVLGGWEVSGIASFKEGFPLAVSGNNILSYGGTPRPNVIGNVHAAHPNIHEWFNTGAFAYAPYGTFGTASRYLSYMRAPGYQDWDSGIMKNWAIRETMRLQFRAEMFNTFNHPQFYAPNASYGGCDPNVSTSCSSSFGKITNSFPGREVQFAGKFYW